MGFFIQQNLLPGILEEAELIRLDLDLPLQSQGLVGRDFVWIAQSSSALPNVEAALNAVSNWIPTAYVLDTT